MVMAAVTHSSSLTITLESGLHWPNFTFIFLILCVCWWGLVHAFGGQKSVSDSLELLLQVGV